MAQFATIVGGDDIIQWDSPVSYAIICCGASNNAAMLLCFETYLFHRLCCTAILAHGKVTSTGAAVVKIVPFL